MLNKSIISFILMGIAGSAQADASTELREFVKNARTGSAEFTQIVIQPDGAKSKQSKGLFEFARPGRFRFTYQQPYSQVIVADGKRLWLHDIELHQVVSRAQSTALNATPAALLAGTDIETNYSLTNQQLINGVEWVMASPRFPNATSDLMFERIKIGFKDKALAALEVTDTLGQRTLLTFEQVRINYKIDTKRFEFKVPSGVDLIQQ